MIKGIPNSIDGKLVTFLATDRLILNGFLVEKESSRSCIVYVHGMTGNFYGGLLSKTLAKRALKYNYSTFVVNTRGHDILSSGRLANQAMKHVTIGTMVEKFEDSIKDLDGALRYLKSIGYARFFLVGHSTGCQKILYYQYVRKRRDVKALALLAPDDDYNLNKRNLGNKWRTTVSRARVLSRTRKSREYNPGIPFSPARFMSIADPKRIEARLFNYEGGLVEFTSVNTPMYVVFGTKDEGAVKPVKEYVATLWRKTSSSNYGSLIIKNARHSFSGYEKVVSDSVIKWISSI